MKRAGSSHKIKYFSSVDALFSDGLVFALISFSGSLVVYLYYLFGLEQLPLLYWKKCRDALRVFLE